MKYISIDVETTGLDSENNDILSIGAIIEDTELKLPFDEIPKFHGAIVHEEVIGSLLALNMNKELIEYIVRYQGLSDIKDVTDLHKAVAVSALKVVSGLEFYNEDSIVEAFYQFLYLNGICGLDINSILVHTMKEINGVRVPCLTSKMKPTTITVAGKNFTGFDKKFLEKLPRWKQAIRVRQRVIDPAILFTDWKNDKNLPSLGECKERANIEGIVTHNALEDAWDVIQLLRTQY